MKSPYNRKLINFITTFLHLNAFARIKFQTFIYSFNFFLVVSHLQFLFGALTTCISY